MYASNQFLEALSLKLMEICDNCIDVDTQSELDELIEKIQEQISVQSKWSAPNVEIFTVFIEKGNI